MCRKKDVNCWCVVIGILLIFDLPFVAAKKQSPELGELLDAIKKQHGNTQTLAVRFRQEKHLSFMDQPIVSDGFILFSAPNKMRFDITSPFQTTMMDNGGKISRFEWKKGSWHAVSVTAGKSIQYVMGQIGQWMQGTFDGQKDVFSLSISFEEPNDYAAIDLSPRRKEFEKYIESIRVHISPPPEYIITRIDIREPQNDHFSLRFVQELKNHEFRNSFFEDPAMAQRCQDMFKDEQYKHVDSIPNAKED